MASCGSRRACPACRAFSFCTSLLRSTLCASRLPSGRRCSSMRRQRAVELAEVSVDELQPVLSVQQQDVRGQGVQDLAHALALGLAGLQVFKQGFQDLVHRAQQQRQRATGQPQPQPEPEQQQRPAPRERLGRGVQKRRRLPQELAPACCAAAMALGWGRPRIELWFLAVPVPLRCSPAGLLVLFCPPPSSVCTCLSQPSIRP